LTWVVVRTGEADFVARPPSPFDRATAQWANYVALRWRAQNQYGGQRDGSKVSVRVSADGNQEYFLNVGSSELEDALKKAIASHREEADGFPPILIQKMVEPEISGSVLNLPDKVIIEAVKGYGTALEEATTVPDIYRVKNGVEKRVPEEQEETTLNPMSNELRRKKVERNGALLKESQVEQLAEKLSSERYSIKFAYKRGTFYAVDAFPTPEVSVMEDMNGLMVSEGEINENTDYERKDRPRDPEKPVIAEKGGATSTPAQIAREKNLPAVFSRRGNLEGEEQTGYSRENTKSPGKASSGTVATEILLADRDLPSRLEEGFDLEFNECYIETARNAISFEGKKAVIDTRRMGKETAFKSLENIDAELKVMIFTELTQEDAEKAVRNGVKAIGVERNLDSANKKLEKAERKLILDAARALLNREESS